MDGPFNFDFRNRQIMSIAEEINILSEYANNSQILRAKIREASETAINYYIDMLNYVLGSYIFIIDLVEDLNCEVVVNIRDMFAMQREINNYTGAYISHTAVAA